MKDEKRILLVDDDKSVLAVLADSLKKLPVPCRIFTAENGFEALDHLQQNRFHVVVVDYNMPQMDGLELMEAVRYTQPTTRLIMITAYGAPYVEQAVAQLHGYRYLTKPVDINHFRRIILQALEEPAQSAPAGSSKLKKQFAQLNHLLKQLQGDVNAHCLVLTDLEGHVIASTGDQKELPLQEMAALLGSSLLTLEEAGRLLNTDENAVHLVYRESRMYYLYALNIGHSYLLTILLKRTPFSTRLGTVWYYAQQTAGELARLLSEIDAAASPRLDTSALDLNITQELDRLFSE